MGAIVPGIKGALNIGHPTACEALNDAACRAGAKLLMGVSNTVVSAGSRPAVSFEHQSTNYRVSPRLVVGADGRGSQVAKQMKVRYSSDPVHHLLSGMLVDGLDDWPISEQSIGLSGDVCFYVFPQGNGRARLYAACGLEQKDRFVGPNGQTAFLSAFDCDALSHVKSFSRARPIGPCHGYPNNDVWLDNPVFDGVILIGDAAGLNDPSGGQGISIAFKDARLVSAALLSNSRWGPDAFSEYVSERQERMRRLRFSGRLLAQIRMDFSPAGKERGQHANQRLQAEPQLFLPLAAFQKGPFAVPDSAFTDETWNRLLHSA
jgi:2-polyprenyl-6-methoxyphenol hydroxylase-like FAD-dependent oxidoreductase